MPTRPFAIAAAVATLSATVALSFAGPVAAQTVPAAGSFLTQMPQGASRMSQIMGVEVIGSDIAKLGEVEDVIIDRNGSVAAVVIGVGGVLGLGGKNVAVPYASLLWNYDTKPTDGARSSNTDSRQTQGAAATAPGPANTEATGTVGDPARPSEGLNVGKVATAVTGGGAPERAQLALTKDELAAAPEFKTER